MTLMDINDCLICISPIISKFEHIFIRLQSFSAPSVGSNPCSTYLFPSVAGILVIVFFFNLARVPYIFYLSVLDMQMFYRCISFICKFNKIKICDLGVVKYIILKYT